MTFQEKIQTVRKTRKWACIICVPFGLLFAGVGLRNSSLFGTKDIGSVITHCLFILCGLGLAGYVLKSYLDIGKRAAAMKAAADNATDDEMSALMADSAVFLGDYYISAMYVLNFETLTAYPRSQIQDFELYTKKHTDSDGNTTGWDYCMDIQYGARKPDQMVFAQADTRKEAYEMLKESLRT